MRRIQIVLVVASLACISSAIAAQETQPQGGQRQGRPNMMAALMQGITLTTEQQTKIDALTKKYDDQRAALRADQSLDMDARRAKGRELAGKQSDEVKTLLTGEQKKVFEKNLADMQARMQQGGGRPPQL